MPGSAGCRTRLVETVDEDFASETLWFDAMIQNVDAPGATQTDGLAR